MDRFFHNKNVLIISPEPWDHLFVSKHHYAIELSKNNRVYFLNPPTGVWSIQKIKYSNVWSVSYPSFISGLRYWPTFIQKYFIKRKYSELQNRLQVTFDCIWSFDNSVFYDFSFLPKHVFTITHVMDYSQNFQLSKAARTAKLCMGVSQNIVDLLTPFNPNTFLMPHGIAIDRAQRIDVELPGTHKVKALFAGNLDRKHFDKDILLTLAKKHPEVDFIFYGSGGKDWERLPNTFYPGIVESELLLNYLTKADVLLLPYKFEGYEKELTNSHKVFDYLRSGKVIVSSYLEDYADKKYLLEMGSNLAEFHKVFSQVAANLEVYNSAAKRKIRIEYASHNSYGKRITEIDDLIQKSLKV